MKNKLYLITNRKLTRQPLLDVIGGALRGGVDIIQLREKDLTGAEVLELARRVGELARELGKKLVINGYPEIAALAGADGVHLGQGAGTVAQAREKIGQDKLVGVSAHNVEEGVRAWREGADYVLVSHIFATSSKAGIPPIGPGLIQEVLAATSGCIPVVALGGINLANFSQVLAAGCSNVAVMSAIMAAADPEKEAKLLKEKLLNC